MKPLSLLGLAIALALPAVVAPRPAAAATVNAVARAIGEEDPFVFTWVDSSDGKLSVSQEIAGQIYDMVANAQYVITDNGQLLLAQLQGQELKTVVPPLTVAKNQENTFFITHMRSPDKTILVDGTIDRYKSDPSKGFAQFTLTLFARDGSSSTTLVQQLLTFPG
jgi:hypothetical protein